MLQLLLISHRNQKKRAKTCLTRVRIKSVTVDDNSIRRREEVETDN